METYPICLVGLERQSCLVVGGGDVAQRKVEALLAAGARPRLVSPAITPELQALAEAGRMSWTPRAYQPGDIDGAFLVIAACDDSAANHAVWQAAHARGCLVNVVDDPLHCNFILPAVVRRGELTVAISTGGSSPALARQLREWLEGELGTEYGDLAALLAELRPELLANLPPGRPRLQAARRLLDASLIEVIRSEGYEAALTHARAELQAAADSLGEAA